MTTLKVNEIFASVQGEGINCGLPSVFLRLAGCNLRCSFCDTKYSWSEGKEMEISEIVKELIKYSYDKYNLVITGGEPLLQQAELLQLLEYLLNDTPFLIEIETNGTITPNKHLFPFIDIWNVSPKLSNSGMFSGDQAYTLHEWEEIFYPFINLKFVVDTKFDLDEIQEYIEKHKDMRIPERHVILMPQCITAKEHNAKLPFIIEFAKEHGYRVSPRLHILAWGNKRGV